MGSISDNASAANLDVEKDGDSHYAHLTNTYVSSYSWENVTVTVKDRESERPKDILSNVSGSIQAGEYNEAVVDNITDAEGRRDASSNGTKASSFHH